MGRGKPVRRQARGCGGKQESRGRQLREGRACGCARLPNRTRGGKNRLEGPAVCGANARSGAPLASRWARVWNSYSIPRVQNSSVIYIYIELVYLASRVLNIIQYSDGALPPLRREVFTVVKSGWLGILLQTSLSCG